MVEAAAGVFGSDRVGIRLSPHGTFNDISDSDLEKLMHIVVESFNPFNLAYLHLVEPRVWVGMYS